MSKDFAGSATVQGTRVVANSINYKNSNISSSIQPEMVRRTSLHPTYNGEEIEDRIYYSLHNDAGTCTFVSPHMKLEITNGETSTSIPNLEEPEKELPIIDIVPKPPIPDDPPNDDDEDTNWPTGGGGGGGGGWSTDNDDDSDTSNPSGPRTDFDDYASLLVASFEPPAGVESVSDVTRFYQNRSAIGGEDFDKAVEYAFSEGNMLIAEAAVVGRELTCAVYFNGKENVALPVIEILTDNEFFDYEAKYNGHSREVCPAQIPDSLRDQIQEVSKKIYSHLGCAGLVRVDYISSEEGLYFLEVNTIPGMTSASLVPQMVRAAGLSMTDFLSTVIENA